ncbi:carbohydrate ABC transporter permease [Kitasatospora purpeofusca]|uniref:carbohydrate ABC transporter permease n=1 Tax=Kitasatospora purpeofusca TaxID=67352 RepID=UPI0035D7EA52
MSAARRRAAARPSLRPRTAGPFDPRAIALTITVAAAALLFVFPFYWLVVAMTHSTTEIFSSKPPLLPGDHLGENVSHLFGEAGFGRAVLNSVLAAGIYTLVGGVVCTLAGYAFATYRFRGAGLAFTLVMVMLAVPFNLTVVPLFKIMVKADLLNTLAGLVLPNLALPFGIFLMRQTLQGFPRELVESGRLDGVGEFGILRRIVLPAMRPSLAALAIYLFLASWNDFLWPLVLLRTSDAYTIPVSLASLHGLIDTDYGQLLSGTAISALPAAGLFLFLQRHFIAGMLAGAVKQ